MFGKNLGKSTIRVPKDRLYFLLTSIFTSSKYCVPAAHATTVASAMLSADLTGHDTHGSQRLPSYLTRIRAGVMSADARPEVAFPAPAVAAIDGCNTFGHVAVATAVDAAIEAAAQFGIGIAGVKRSNHFGTAGWVVERSVEKGYAAIVFTNSSPALPPWGGREKLLGVSPLAAGLPGSEALGVDNIAIAEPFILDMAPSVAARGKIIKAKRRGEKIPEGWALDAQGKMTTDPDAALEGTMLPIGGPKGSALAIFMDLFSGLMTGAAFAGAVASPYDLSRPADVGHSIIVMRPDLFVNKVDLTLRLHQLWTSVTESKPAAEVDRVWVPGEREQETRKERTSKGIPFTRDEINILNAEARDAGVEEITVSEEKELHPAGFRGE